MAPTFGLVLDCAERASRRATSASTSVGATRGERIEQPGTYWVVMTDPEGNEFCVGREPG